MSDPTDVDRIIAHVPACLCERDQWVGWKRVERAGKPTKIPVDPVKARRASVTNAATWGTFEQAVKSYERRSGLAGVGFVFTPDDPFAGIDLDDCIDPATGQVKPWARQILDRLDTYAETSPSGKGIKAFVQAEKRGTRCKTAYESGAVEVYDRARFFTITGLRLEGLSANVETRQAELDFVYGMIFGSKSTVGAEPREHSLSHLDDDEIIRLARRSQKAGEKFRVLWEGRWQEAFVSQSEADASLACRLAFYSKDAAQIDRIFRRSGLMRAKWDERHGRQTYGELTIATALSTVTEQFQPSKRRGESTRQASNKSAQSPAEVPQPGTIDPITGRLVLSTDRTLPTAKAYLDQFHQHADGMTLRHYAGDFVTWRENRYVAIEDAALQHQLLPWLHAAVRMIYAGRDLGAVAEDFPANPRTVKTALESIKSFTYLSTSTAVSPSWLDRRDDRPDPAEILPCRSALFHVPTMRRLEPTPAFFTVNALDYDHDPDAPEPKQWQSFLDQLFKDDFQSHRLLQEWFGYCLTGDTSQQKMLMIVGPRRGGKGTIARVLTRLVGAGNVTGPTTSSLAGHFGLQPLIGKSLAIVSDARFAGKDVTTVIERLLCVSGEDTLTIDRKYKTSVTVKLPTRFMFLTNELPRLTDASGALAGRFMMLRLTKSFYAREDKALTAKLLTELSGILNWAVEGWQKLRDRGCFVQPSSVEDALREMEDLSSPVGAFVRERCDVGPGLRVWIDELYHAWKVWCEADGRVKATTKQTLGRDLMAAVPGISTRVGTEARFYQGIALKGGSH